MEQVGCSPILPGPSWRHDRADWRRDGAVQRCNRVVMAIVGGMGAVISGWNRNGCQVLTYFTWTKLEVRWGRLEVQQVVWRCDGVVMAIDGDTRGVVSEWSWNRCWVLTYFAWGVGGVMGGC